MSIDLSENSSAYYDENKNYLLFSQAEDYPQKILNFLKPQVCNKKVLDLGCGNGKYLELLSPHCTIFGLDKSFEQLTHAKNHPIVNADASKLPFSNNSFDVIFSCWMLGTILDLKKQEQIISEMKRVIKNNGVIFLIENGEGNLFEELRGRNNDPLQRTLKYNQFLEKSGFSLIEQFETYFQFPNDLIAKNVINNIWKNKIIHQNFSFIIPHNINIYRFILFK